MVNRSPTIMASTTLMRAPKITLNDGNKMPIVGLGTFQGSYDYSSPYDNVVKSVKSAIDIGYRHFDTAFIYDTEKGLGDAINNRIDKGVITRQELFITTKVWSTYHRRADVEKGLRKSLSTMGLDYADMLLIHWPMAIQRLPNDESFTKDDAGNIDYTKVVYEDDKHDITETWQGMEDCKRLGLAKSIGISNFNHRQIERILEKCTIRPSSIQIEVHVHHNNKRLVDFCKQHDIQVCCFSPIGKPSRPWAKAGDPFVFTDPVILEIGEKYVKTAAQIALKFLVQQNLVVVPKSNSPERQAQNLNIFDFTLSGEEMARIHQCNQDFRVLWMSHYDGSKEYPFHEEW